MLNVEIWLKNAETEPLKAKTAEQAAEMHLKD